MSKRARITLNPDQGTETEQDAEVASAAASGSAVRDDSAAVGQPSSPPIGSHDRTGNAVNSPHPGFEQTVSPAQALNLGAIVKVTLVALVVVSVVLVLKRKP